MTIQQGIYKIENTISKKVYIGSSVNIKSRFGGHKKHLGQGIHRCKHLQYSWNKYGPDAFSFSIIELVEDKNNLIEREQFWMDTLRKTKILFNSCPLAGSPLGMKLTKEQRLKISAALKNKPKSEEAKQNMSISAKARIRTKEEIEQWAKNRLGSKQSKEHIEKRAEGQVKTKALWSPEQKLKIRLKRAITNNSLVKIEDKIYLSYNHASEILGVSKHILRKTYPKMSPIVLPPTYLQRSCGVITIP